MRNELNVWVVGGDMRQAKLAELLSEDGHTVHTWALEQAEDAVEPARDLGEAHLADCVVLPLPAAGEGGRLNAPLSDRRVPLETVLDALRPGQVVCAGRVDAELRAMAEARGLRLCDYFAREELAVANAVPAALAVWRRKEGYPGGLRHIVTGAGGRPRRWEHGADGAGGGPGGPAETNQAGPDPGAVWP